jgi:hypothetical protein
VSELWLTPEEVRELTDRERWTAQCRALAKMGVPFTPNAVGRPLVERAAVCSKPAAPKPRRKAEPNWSALRGKAA